MVDYKVDYSEVAGKKVECPDQCGMCCLCQPEVLPEERAFFRNNHPQSLVRIDGDVPYFALALKKGRGSCVFLNNRRCTIYDHRTAYCRQYPYHIYTGENVRVELNLSCRGVWYGTGADASKEVEELISKADSRIRKALRESREVYNEFYSNCKEAGIIADPESLRMSVSKNLRMFTDLSYLSRIMDMAQIEPVMSLDGLMPETRLDMEALEEAGCDSAMESMSSQDPLSVPVYCDPQWNWNMFFAVDDTIEWMVMDDDGELHHKAFAKSKDIHLVVPDNEGLKVLADYISILNRRDSFMGSVFSSVDYNGYEDNLANAYYGSMAVTVMDLLWRMSMLDHFMHIGNGADAVKEAIIFYDMDRLDAPAIGAFV